MRRLQRAGWILLVALVLLPVPAFVAPYVSDDPVAWAYRVYHPFMYRYPAIFGTHVDLDRPVRFIDVAKLMIEFW